MPNYAIPYSSNVPLPQDDGTITKLLLQRGQIASDAARASGDIWGGVIGSLGKIAADYLSPERKLKQQQMQAQTEALNAQADERKQAAAAKERSALQDRSFMDIMAKSNGAPDPQAVMGIYGPERGLKVIEGISAFHKLNSGDAAEATQHLGRVVSAMDQLGDAGRAAMYPVVHDLAKKTGLVPPGALPDAYDSASWGQISGMAKKLAGVEPKMVNVAPGGVVFNETTGKPEFTAPKEVTPPNFQHVETREGIRLLNPRTGELGPVIAQPKPTGGPAVVINPSTIAAGQAGKLDETTGRNEELLKTLSPSDAATVKALVEYDRNPQGMQAGRGGQGNQLIALAHQYDPNYSESTYPARSALRRSFTAGSDAANVTAINTVAKHLNTLADAGDELKNAPVQLWNEIKNKGLTEVGDPRVIRFKEAAQAVSTELGKAYRNGSGQVTEGEIKEWQNVWSMANSPAQMDAALRTGAELLSGKMEALSTKYENGMGKKPSKSLFSPEASSALEKLKKRGQPAELKIGGYTVRQVGD